MASVSSDTSSQLSVHGGRFRSRWTASNASLARLAAYLTRLSCSQLILIRSSQAHDIHDLPLVFPALLCAGLFCGASCVAFELSQALRLGWLSSTPLLLALSSRRYRSPSLRLRHRVTLPLYLRGRISSRRPLRPSHQDIASADDRDPSRRDTFVLRRLQRVRISLQRHCDLSLLSSFTSLVALMVAILVQSFSFSG